ncbi:MAG: hypothetical protein WCV71_02645 [Patescibacteria group bacterium]
MLINDLKTLPEEVQDFIWETMSDVNYTIFDKFSFDFAQFEFFNKLEDDILLKKKNIIDLPKDLEKMPGQFKGDFRELALQMATEIFWPLQEYLGGVDRLILRLGAKVPRAVFLKKKNTTVVDNQLPEVFQGRVKDLMEKYEEFKDLRLTPNKLVNEKGLMVNASVQNWINDYIHFLGAGQHNSLERAVYLSKSPNVLELTDKYRDSLRYLLLSYDEGVELYFNYSQGFLFIEEQPTKKSTDKEAISNKMDFDKFLGAFKNKLTTFQKQLLPSDMIISESQGDINKVRDILWQAIGISDKDKAISCLKLLVERKTLDLMIKEDNRFKNTLKRFIGIKYGQNMERSLAENIDQLIIRRLFLEMILSDKLRLSEEELYVTVFYLTNILPNSGQLIYLDEKDQKFKWRAVQVSGNKFAWVDKI